MNRCSGHAILFQARGSRDSVPRDFFHLSARPRIPENDKAAVWEPVIDRVIEASGMVHVPWIAMHPVTYPDDNACLTSWSTRPPCSASMSADIF